MAGAANLLDCAVSTDYEQAFAQALHAVRPSLAGCGAVFRAPAAAHRPARLRAAHCLGGRGASARPRRCEDLYFAARILPAAQRPPAGRPGGCSPARSCPTYAWAPPRRACGSACSPLMRRRRTRWPPRQLPQAAAAALESGQRPGAGLYRPDPAGWPGQRLRRPRARDAAWGLLQAGTQRPVFISSGQHANEDLSGVVGALRRRHAAP